MTDHIRTRVRRQRPDQSHTGETGNEYRDAVSEILEPGESDVQSPAEQFQVELDDMMSGVPADLPTDPAVRLRYFNEVYGIHAAKEYAFRTMIKLMMRGSRVETIAQVFNIHIRTVYKWRKEQCTLLLPEYCSLTL